MKTLTRQEAIERGIVVLVGWALIQIGAAAQWGWPAAVMVLGLWLALPARYVAPDKVIVKD